MVGYQELRAALRLAGLALVTLNLWKLLWAVHQLATDGFRSVHQQGYLGSLELAAQFDVVRGLMELAGACLPACVGLVFLFGSGRLARRLSLRRASA